MKSILDESVFYRSYGREGPMLRRNGRLCDIDRCFKVGALLVTPPNGDHYFPEKGQSLDQSRNVEYKGTASQG